MNDQMITLTPAAIEHAARLRDQAGGYNLHLRVTISAGGCAGLRYNLDFEPPGATNDTDETLTFHDGAGRLLIVNVDTHYAPYIDGTTIDWVETLNKTGFEFHNPNQTQACACGDSFC